MRMKVFALALGGLLLAAPAVAAPALDVRLPVVAADLKDGKVALRLVRGLGSRGLAAATRSVTLQAYDADGKSLGSSSIVLSARLTYAEAPLSPAMMAASQIVVTSR